MIATVISRSQKRSSGFTVVTLEFKGNAFYEINMFRGNEFCNFISAILDGAVIRRVTFCSSRKG